MICKFWNSQAHGPFQNICTNTVPYVQTFNQRLANDVSGFGIIVDVFSAFDGKICTYTWMCAVGDIHPNDQGYIVIANTFAAAIPPD